MANLAIPKVSQWDFKKRHVQPNIDDFGSFIRSASVLLAAGPPKLSSQFSAQQNRTVQPSNLDDVAFPIGVVENFALAQNKQLQTIFEIGSDRRYFIPGRTINNVSLSRVLMDGPSVMKVMYNTYLPFPGAVESTNGPLDGIRFGNSLERKKDIKDLPGQDSMFLNLASDLFNLPMGLLVMFKNNCNENVAAVYLERCFINSHNMNINASSILVAEAVNIQFDKVVPVNLQSTVADNGGVTGLGI
jgi:hypothetical protein